VRKHGKKKTFARRFSAARFYLLEVKTGYYLLFLPSRIVFIFFGKITNARKHFQTKPVRAGR
jgi:hypothetical protein